MNTEAQKKAQKKYAKSPNGVKAQKNAQKSYMNNMAQIIIVLTKEQKQEWLKIVEDSSKSGNQLFKEMFNL